VYRTLYDHVRRAAQEAGDVVGIRLYVERDNRTAQETYRRLGMCELPFHLMQELVQTSQRPELYGISDFAPST
jgi:ribosomal protein S18 acetylase RimI-like enzyme